MPTLTDGLYGSAGSGELRLSLQCGGWGSILLTLRDTDAIQVASDSDPYRVLKDFNQMGKL